MFTNSLPQPYGAVHEDETRCIGSSTLDQPVCTTKSTSRIAWKYRFELCATAEDDRVVPVVMRALAEEHLH
eukprot:12908617-Prorocentrum_lima.AAC.1